MAQSASNNGQGLVNTGALTPTLRDRNTPEELRGPLEAVLLSRGLSANRCQKYAAKIVDEGCFDLSSALADLTIQALESLDIPVGHRAVVMRAAFDGGIPQSALGSPVPPSPQVWQAPPQSALGEVVIRHDSSIRREWPTGLTALGSPHVDSVGLGPQGFRVSVRASINDVSRMSRSQHI